MSTSDIPRRAGVIDTSRANGQPLVTTIRRTPADERPPGAMLVSAATVLLGVLAVGLFMVSLAAQYRYVFDVKHQALPSLVEAIGLDAGMTIFSLLALGLARAGQSARIERALIVACAVGSAAMNYAAADDGSPRSVAAYVMPPVFLAIVVDRVIAVVRRHVLGDSERSAWAALGTVALYLLRLVLALPSTVGGLRRWVLNVTPLPAAAPETAEVAGPAVLPAAAGKEPPTSLESAGAVPNGRTGPGIAATTRPARPPAPRPGSGGQPRASDQDAAEPVTNAAIEAHYAAELGAGAKVPSRKAIRRRWGVGSVRAGQIYASLTAAAAAQGAK